MHYAAWCVIGEDTVQAQPHQQALDCAARCDIEEDTVQAELQSSVCMCCAVRCIIEDILQAKPCQHVLSCLPCHKRHYIAKTSQHMLCCSIHQRKTHCTSKVTSTCAILLHVSLVKKLYSQRYVSLSCAHYACDSGKSRNSTQIREDGLMHNLWDLFGVGSSIIMTKRTTWLVAEVLCWKWHK